MYRYTVTWMGRVYSGYRPTPEAAQRAKVEKIQWLRETYPKGPRRVEVRAAV